MHNKSSLKIYKPWDAFIAKSVPTPIHRAIGKRVGAMYRLYPPGSSRIFPSQIFTQNHFDEIKDALANNDKIVGLSQDPQSQEIMIDVLVETATKPEKFSIQTYSPDALSSCDIDEISNMFCSGFALDPYRHFAAFKQDPSISLPPSLDFQEWKQSYYIQDEGLRRKRQNTLLEEAGHRSRRWYSCSDLDEIKLPDGFFRWAEQELCHQAMIERFKDPGYVTCVREIDSGDLRGFLHARMVTLERCYLSEEWANPCLFSYYHDSKMLDDPNRFYSKIFDSFALRPNSKIMIISAQILHPDAIGGEVFYEMMASMAKRVTPYHASLPLLCEIPNSGTSHHLNIAATQRLARGVLKNGHPLVYNARTSDGLFNFIAGRKFWRYRLKESLKNRQNR